MKIYLLKLAWDKRKVISVFIIGVLLISSFFSLGLLSNIETTGQKLKDLHCDELLESNYTLDLSFLVDNIKSYSLGEIDYIDKYLIAKTNDKCTHINRISKALNDMVQEDVITEEQKNLIYNMQLSFRNNIEEMEVPYKEFKIVQQDYEGAILESASRENYSVKSVLPGEVVEISQYATKTINTEENKQEIFTQSIKIKNKVYAGKNSQNENQIYEYYTYIIGLDKTTVKKGDIIPSNFEIGTSKRIYWQLIDEHDISVDLRNYVPELQSQLEVLKDSNTSLSKGDNERLLKIDRMVPILDSYQVTANVGWYSPFGSRIHHNGIDLASTLGTTIVSATNGKVVQSGYHNGYGNYVFIENNGIKFIYAHMRYRSRVSKGDIVKKGQVIGYMGTTGFSTGVHLHFEIRDLENNKSVINPELYFKFK